MARIRILTNYNFSSGHPIVRVYYYKSDAAYFNPEEHPNDILEHTILLNGKNIKDAINDLTHDIETAINELLNHKESLDE